MTLGPYRAIGLRFTVDCDHEPTAAVTARVFAGLVDPAPCGEPDVAFTMVQDPPGVWQVLADGAPVSELLAAAAVIHHVLMEVNLRLVDASMGRWSLLHAAGVARGGRVVALPAPTHSGKSTLVAWLAHHDWEYVTDETVAVAPGTLEVTAYRKPVAVRQGAQAVLAGVIPEVTAADEAYFDWEHLVLPPSSGTCIPGRLAMMAFPRFDPDQPGVVAAPLRPAEALVRLAHNCHEFERMGAPAFRRLEAIARSVPAFELTYSDLRAATGRLHDLLEDQP